MNKKALSIVLYVIVVINYICARFIFFNIHGMKDMPNTMALISAALVAFFILSDKIFASIAACIGNTIGFILGYLFNTTTVDYITGNTNNYWLIWIISYAIIVVIGLIIDRMFHVKHR